MTKASHVHNYPTAKSGQNTDKSEHVLTWTAKHKLAKSLWITNAMSHKVNQCHQNMVLITDELRNILEWLGKIARGGKNHS